MERGRRQLWLMVHMMMLRLALLLARSMLANRGRRAVVGPQPPPPPPPNPAPLQRRRGPVIQRRRLNPLGLTDQQVLTTYRLDMNTIMDLLHSIEADITSEIRIGTAISPLLKLVSVLHFCATGIFQHSTSMLHGLSQPMFCRILKQVMAAILKRAKEHIYMPTTSAQMNPMKAAFFAIARFPHVIGCIDGTHIPIVPPSLHEQAYRNRKMTHSMNVQMVCNSNMCIMNVCARFPGSAHDSRILRSSTFYDYMEQHVPPRTVILGDSGYPLLPWLLTPVRNPQTPAESNYNHAHIRTRVKIENAFGLLKSRFRCLDRTGGALLYKPRKVGDIIVMCVILHNIAIRRRVPLPDGGDPPAGDDDDGQHHTGQVDANEGQTVRNAIIAQFFST